MSCAACAVSVQSMLQSKNGVISASVNYGNKTVRLEYDPEIVELQELKKTLQGIGYDLFLDEEDKVARLEALEHKRYILLARRLVVAILFSLPVFILSMFFHHAIAYQNDLLFGLSLPVILYSGSEFYLSAIRQIRYRVFAMDSLVATGTGAAFLYSTFNTFFPEVLSGFGMHPDVYFESAVIVIAFILLGRFLEEKAKKSASSAIRKLTGLQPKMVTVERDGETFDLSPALVIPGDRIVVRPGDKIPVDGSILSGESMVDESSITGEPMPVNRKTGDPVFAGTISGTGVMTVEAVKAGNETLLSQIIRLVEEAQSTKPPVQKIVDRITGVFVPVVFALSALTFIIWMLAGSPATAIVTSISVLIIACPCALGLATPTALISGLGRGAAEGILIRNAAVLETAGNVDTILLDKTGTITQGKPSVKEIVWSEAADASDRSMLATMETASNHPLATAAVKFLALQGIKAGHPYDSLTEKGGKGLEAHLNGEVWYAGSNLFMAENGIPIIYNNIAGPTASEGTCIYFARQKQLLATILLTDEVKKGSAEAVASFNRHGLNVAMVSGDTFDAASVVAGKAGIKEVYAPVLPDAKGNLVKQLQERGRKVCMVGDGINDAYALAQSDLGIAMGNGTDVAIESAGIVLSRPDLMQAVKALRLSVSVRKIIRQNLFWAFIYNIIAIPVAAGILIPLTGFMLNPMLAGAAMAMSSVTVVTNSLRLRTMNII